MDHKSLLSKRISVIAHHILQPEQKESMCNPSNCSAEKSLIEAERAKASFEVEKLTWYLEGSAQYAQFKQLVASVMEGDDVYFDKNRYDRTREEARAQTMLKMKRVMEAWQLARGDAMTKRKKPSSNKAVSEDQVGFGGTGETISDAFWETMALYDPGWSTKMGVHFGLFQFAINGQGSDEQKAKYADAINNLRIFGCFAMTELGHGSHTRGLETTATYDKESKEFVINSPTITSLKWWIGAAGQTATHAVVYAQLIVNGDCKGLHSFVVQIRSLETGDPMPGIDIGDCGAKMGRDGIDNGWIQFNNIRIPRENMLMRWAKVTEEGEYESPPKKELAYGALMGGRVAMVKDSYAFIKKALVIAIRYSAVRRQGEGNNQVLDYQSHQHRLFPILAGAYALQATTKVLAEAFLASREALSSEDLSGLADVHATSAGLKAFCTWWTNESLETCRQCLGGHGYSAYSGFAEMLGDFGVMCSWEGDNAVLAQQTARYLMKKRNTVYKGKRLSGFVKYLANAEKTLSLKCRATTLEDLAKSEVQIEAFRRLAVGWVTETSDRLRNEKNVKKNPNAWNDCLIDLVETAKVHCYFFMANSFIEAVAKAPEEVRPILKKLSDLFVWNFVAAASGPLLANGYITARQLGLIRKYIRVLYKEIRPNAVALVDAFNLPDSVVGSPFGASDGDVYNKYLEVVKNAPGNANKAPWWDTIVKPLLHRPELEAQQN